MNPLLIASIAAIFAFVSALCAIWAAFRASKAANYGAECANWMDQNNKKAKIVRVEGELTELFDSVSSLRESLHKIRSRLAMRERREREKTPGKGPKRGNTPEDRDAERAALEKELAESGRLNPRIHLTGQN